MYVPEGNNISVFARGANGNVAPIRIPEGPEKRLGGGNTAGAGVVAIDPIHNLLIAIGGRGTTPNRNQILIFDRTASGNTKPKAIITGPDSMLTNLVGPADPIWFKAGLLAGTGTTKVWSFPFPNRKASDGARSALPSLALLTNRY